MNRTRAAALLVAGLLVSGSSSCYFNSAGTGAATGGAAVASVAGLAAMGAVYCMVETDDCFPDWEALEAARAARAKADADFLAGLHAYMDGDPGGLDLICDAARQGDPRAQQFYGAELLQHAPERRDEALSWLRQAAAQGNDHADLLLRRSALQGKDRARTPDDAQNQAVAPEIGPCERPGELSAGS